MIFLLAAIGLLLIVATLWEAFETIILPRRVTRRFRFTRVFFRTTWFPWRGVARRIRSPRRREGFLSVYGPLSILTLFALWATLLIFGFGLLTYARRGAHAGGTSIQTCFYLSGTTFFTLGLGDVTPQSPLERFLAVVESGLGFGFLALVLSYLPVIYQAFSRREVSIVLLDARAGSPPTAAELLRRHVGPHGLEELKELLHEWERWSAEILESHVSYPVVSYFRSQHNNESWVGALAAILDTSALLISHAEDACSRQARLTFAICRHTVVDLAQVFSAAPALRMPDRLPPSELARLRSMLAQSGLQLRDSSEANKKLAHLREMYEPYLQALATFLYMELPPWILAKEITDNWRTSAWGRVAGFAGASGIDAPADDHSD
jgi:Ion channel